MPSTIGVDIGGTKIAAAVVGPDGGIVAKQRVKTPSASEEAIRVAVAELIRPLARRHEVGAVGVSAAGLVDKSGRTVVFAPNLAWRDEPLAEHISADVGLPVHVENDANAAAWGEFQYGAAQHADDCVMVTIGTGIGGGIVHDGQLVHGGFGLAAEIGHMRITRGGLPCGCGNRGCWEQYGSGTALTRLGADLVDSGGAGAARLSELADGDPDQLTGPMITKAAKEGDEASVELLAAFGLGFGEALASLAAILDPELIVVGGGVCEAGELLLEPVRRGFRDNLVARRYRPIAEIVVAELGNDAGVIGAADLARGLL